MNKNVSLKIFQFIIIIAISALIGYYFGVNKVRTQWKDFKPIISIKSKEPPSGSSLDMKLFYEVLNRVSTEYYDQSKIDAQKVLYGAISGMLSSLDDPYTSFFPPKQNSAFKEALAGEFQGIGAELGLNSENIIMVVAPLDSSPALKAGIKAADLILKVNDEDTRGWTIQEAVEKIRGPKGTEVSLVILHEGENKTKDIKIVRDVIQIDSVRSWVKRIECKNNICSENSTCLTCNTIAYIRLSQFGDRTNAEWVSGVNDISSKTQSDKNFKGIILDVRNNPGGYLNDAVFIASEFLDSGVVVQQEDKVGQRSVMKVNRKGLFTKTPIIILINKGSASASEIVAGALRDHKRAKLIGEKSFGKGTIQEAIEMGEGASIHVSVAKWLTPDGTWVQKEGLAPDMEVKFDEKTATDPAAFDNQLQAAITKLTK